VPSFGVPVAPPVEVGGGVTLGLAVTPATPPSVGDLDGAAVRVGRTDPLGSAEGAVVGGSVGGWVGDAVGAIVGDGVAAKDGIGGAIGSGRTVKPVVRVDSVVVVVVSV
jgi:hypothetical protein